MHKVKLNLHNWKLIEDMSIELNDDSYLYLVKGQNDSGKTSVLQAILSLLTIKNFVPKPLKDGEKSGVIEGTFLGPDGSYYVKMDITETNATFQMFDPKGMRISRVNDMRKVFQYNSMTTEDFIKKSYSAEGRREQIKILGSLLDIDNKIEFETLLADVDKRKGRLFLERKKAKAAYEAIHIRLKDNEVSEEDLNVYQNSSKIDEFLKQLREKERVLSVVPPKDEELRILEENFNISRSKLMTRKTDLEFDNKSIDGEIKLLEEKIRNLRDRKKLQINQLIEINNKIIEVKENYEANVAATERREDTTEELKAVREEIEKIEADRSRVLRIAGRIEDYKILAEQEPDIKKAYQEAEEKLEKARASLLDIIGEIKIPGYNLSIEDDTIFIDGYPLNEHQLADSKLIIAVSAILAKVNKNSPILVVGKLAELDKSSLNKLEMIAKDNDCIIIGDYVTDDVNEIVVEGHVSEGLNDVKISMDNTGKPHKQPDSLDEI